MAEGENKDHLSPDMPGFEFGRFLLARPVGDTAVCLFELAPGELMLVTFGEYGFTSSGEFDGPSASTVNDSEDWVIAAPRGEGEPLPHVTLEDGTELVLSYCQEAWLAVAPAKYAHQQATATFRVPGRDWVEVFPLMTSWDGVPDDE